MKSDVLPLPCPRCRFPLELATTTALDLFVYCPVCWTGVALGTFQADWEAAKAKLKRRRDNAPNN